FPARGSGASIARVTHSPETRSFPLTPALDEDFFLSHCEGYAVERNGAQVGVDENVVFESKHDRPASVLVRRGFLRRRIDTIGVEEIEEISPSVGRLRLK
ncbi:MAG: hypothetical protein ACXVRQ_08630, partial [Gaiellaceae bacterium]